MLASLVLAEVLLAQVTNAMHRGGNAWAASCASLRLSCTLHALLPQLRAALGRLQMNLMRVVSHVSCPPLSPECRSRWMRRLLHSPSLGSIVQGWACCSLSLMNMFSSAGNACSVMLVGIGPAPTENAGSKTACWPLGSGAPPPYQCGCDLRLHPKAFDCVVPAVQLHEVRRWCPC